MEYQYELLGWKAQELGKIYRALLAHLDAAGISTELLKAFCEEKVRPDIKSYSTDAAERVKYLKALSYFEQPDDRR